MEKKSYFMYELTLITENFKMETTTQLYVVVKKEVKSNQDLYV